MKYEVEATEMTPKIYFDQGTGVFEITGKSFWENADSLYGPILSWLEDVYLPKPAAETKLTVQLDYFNTATAKALLGVFKHLEKVQERGNSVLIIWRYNEADEDLEDSGLDYQELTSVKIILESFKED